MPSPVGHTLAGCCLAAFAARAGGGTLARHSAAAILVAANLPDADFLLGPLLRPLGIALEHQGPTHSLAFVAAAALLAALLQRRDRGPLRAFAFLLAAGALHLLLDVFNYDGGAPAGVPLLWPLDPRAFHSPAVLFPGVDRAHVFGEKNLRELLVELAIGVPSLLLALRLARRAPPR